MFSRPMNTLLHAGARRLVDEVRDLVAQRVDLDDHLDVRCPSRFAQLDDAVEDRLPVLVAGEIVVGDEKPVEALREMRAQQMLDVVRRAAARLAALHVDDGAERALIRTAAAGVERGVMIGRAFQVLRRQERRRRRFQPRQLVHVIVDRLRACHARRRARRVEAALFRFAGEQAAAHVERLLQIGLHAGQHGDAAGNMKAADHHRNAGIAQRPRDVERARKLVRLHADQSHHPEIVVAFELRDDVLDTHARVGLVRRCDVDGDIRTERLPFDGVAGQRIDRRQRIGRNGRARPLNDVAVAVVMRRLDQHELETAVGPRHRRKHEVELLPPYPSRVADFTGLAMVNWPQPHAA